jgi:hypothetical protein
VLTRGCPTKSHKILLLKKTRFPALLFISGHPRFNFGAELLNRNETRDDSRRKWGHGIPNRLSLYPSPFAVDRYFRLLFSLLQRFYLFIGLNQELQCPFSFPFLSVPSPFPNLSGPVLCHLNPSFSCFFHLLYLKRCPFFPC